MTFYNPFKRIRELQEVERIHKVEIDSLALQLEECRGTNSTLERWLAEVRQERDELKQNLYRISGIIRETPKTAPVFQQIPTGRVPWRKVQTALEESRKRTTISKDTIDEIEKEVGIKSNAS